MYKRFVYLDKNAFAGLIRVQCIRIQHCQLTHMPPLDPIKRSVSFINLGPNNISCVPENYFDGYSHLRNLYLTRNKLSILPNVQQINRTLKVFLLNYNNISALSVSVIGHEFKRLKELGLRSNSLTAFDVGFLSYWPSLSLLDISSNPLTTVPNISGFDMNRSQETTMLFGSNAIACDSDMAWLFDGLQNDEYIGHFYQRKSVRLDGFMRSKCTEPMNLRGRNVGKLSK